MKNNGQSCFSTTCDHSSQVHKDFENIWQGSIGELNYNYDKDVHTNNLVAIKLFKKKDGKRMLDLLEVVAF